MDAIERMLHERSTHLVHPDTAIAFVQHQMIMHCNDPCARLFGYRCAEDMLGRPGSSFHPDPTTFHRLGRIAHMRLSKGRVVRARCLLRRSNGSLFWSSVIAQAVSPGRPEDGAIWILNEMGPAPHIPDSTLFEKVGLFEHAGVGILWVRNGLLVRCNRHFETMLGHGPGDMDGSLVREAFASTLGWQHFEQGLSERLALGQGYAGEAMLVDKGGNKLFCEIRCTPIDPNDTAKGMVWVAMESLEHTPTQAALAQVHEQLEQQVRDRTRDQDRIYWLAHYDPLTGLPNRTLLAHRSTQAIQLAQDNDTPLAAIFLDLDHFKHVNDSLGHRVGDALLVEIAKRLRSVVREKDTVSRIGGDEFVLLLPGANAHGAARVASKLLEASRQPYQIDHHELTMAPSMGIALYPQDGTDFDTLTQSADVAMYHAKLDGRNTFRFFTPEMRAQSLRALQLENALRRALERQELHLHYQPQVCLHTGRVHSVEALLRWNHPKLGAISPAEFIPVAEDSGQILQIGEWVLRTAVQQLQEWRAQGMGDVKVAVNLSAIQFNQPQLPELISQVLQTCGVPPDALELELTEGVAVNDPRTATETMDRLRARGVRLSIDDFGTGYSSLSQLKRFHIYKLKIDQSFVRDLDHNANDRAIVSAIIRMAQALGMQTTAEGVETEAQLDILRELGCNEAQGYYFSRPLPPDEIPALLRRLDQGISHR